MNFKGWDWTLFTVALFIFVAVSLPVTMITEPHAITAMLGSYIIGYCSGFTVPRKG